MRRFAVVVVLGISMLGFAQDKPVPAKEPTIAELKLQIAQKDVEIATLKIALIKAQGALALKETQDDLEKAQKAVLDLNGVPKPTETPMR